jgi:hypothetical protein
LLETINRFLQLSAETILNGDTFRWGYVYFFIQDTIEVGGADVHLIKFQIIFGSERANDSDGLKVGYRCKGFLVVDTFLLNKPARDNSEFEALNVAVLVKFDSHDRFGGNGLDAIRSWYSLIDIIIIKVFDFLHHCLSPLR